MKQYTVTTSRKRCLLLKLVEKTCIKMISNFVVCLFFVCCVFVVGLLLVCCWVVVGLLLG